MMRQYLCPSQRKSHGTNLPTPGTPDYIESLSTRHSDIKKHHLYLSTKSRRDTLLVEQDELETEEEERVNEQQDTDKQQIYELRKQVETYRIQATQLKKQLEVKDSQLELLEHFQSKAKAQQQIADELRAELACRTIISAATMSTTQVESEEMTVLKQTYEELLQKHEIQKQEIINLHEKLEIKYQDVQQTTQEFNNQDKISKLSVNLQELTIKNEELVASMTWLSKDHELKRRELNGTITTLKTEKEELQKLVEQLQQQMIEINDTTKINTEVQALRNHYVSTGAMQLRTMEKLVVRVKDAIDALDSQFNSSFSSLTRTSICSSPSQFLGDPSHDLQLLQDPKQAMETTVALVNEKLKSLEQATDKLCDLAFAMEEQGMDNGRGEMQVGHRSSMSMLFSQCFSSSQPMKQEEKSQYEDQTDSLLYSSAKME